MSTDKTLADVQPGGRVRLGDQAERARFEAWAEDRELGTAKCSADGMNGDYADLSTDWCWAAWQAALSAQPSPGGQADVLAMPACKPRAMADDLPGYYESDRDWLSDRENAIALSWLIDNSTAIRAALAARQPVGDCSESALYEAVGNLLEAPGSWTSGYTDALHDLREAYSRYGQKPVMQGPLAEVSSKSFNSDGTSNIITPALPLGTKLYAPPAQAVDVEDVLGKAMDMAKGGCGSASVVEWITEQLIDSPAVGNG